MAACTCLVCTKVIEPHNACNSDHDSYWGLLVWLFLFPVAAPVPGDVRHAVFRELVQFYCARWVRYAVHNFRSKSGPSQAAIPAKSMQVSNLNTAQQLSKTSSCCCSVELLVQLGSQRTADCVFAVYMGRYLMSLWMGDVRIHELYTAACGLYTCWVLLRVATVVYNWAPQGFMAIFDRVQEWVVLVSLMWKSLCCQEVWQASQRQMECSVNEILAWKNDFDLRQ